MSNNPRNRNLVQLGAPSTQKARLPAFPALPRSLDPAVYQFLEAVKERLEVREGSRGNPFEAVVTKRDLNEMGVITSVGLTAEGNLEFQTSSGSTVVSIDAFAEGIRNTRLYQNLVQRLDDPTRFDYLPAQVQAVLLTSIAEEAAKRGADIRSMETKIQTLSESFAMKVSEVTAAVGQAAAGVRDLTFAYATENTAQAGKITQLEASLGNYYQDGSEGRAVLEETLTTTVDRLSGIAAEYMVKVQVGTPPKVAGFGLSATEDPDGLQDSAFIVLADKFAVVTPSDAIADPLNPPANRIPFGVDANGVYINGQLRVDATGPSLDQLSKSVTLTATSTVFRVNTSGVADPASITLTATLNNGLSGTVSFTVVDGTATLTGSGNTRTLTYGNMATNRVTVRASVTESGKTYNNDLAIYKAFDGTNGTNGTNGIDGLTAVLSNEAHTLPASAGGVVSSYAGSGTTINVFEGSTALAAVSTLTANSQFTVGTPTQSPASTLVVGGRSYSSTTATVATHSAMSNAVDSVVITYPISVRRANGTTVTIDKAQTITKSKVGVAGADGVAYWLQASVPAVQKSVTNVYTPASVTYTIMRSEGTQEPALYAGRFIIATSTDGSNYTNQYTSASNQSSYSYAVPANIKTIRVRAYLAGGTTTLVDELITTVVSDGATGVRGSVTRYGSGAWSDATANSLVPNGTPVIGDTVTLSTSTSAVTKYWSGVAWVDPGMVIDGNLLVNGTISGDKIAVNSLYAGNISAAKVQMQSSSFTTNNNLTTNANGHIDITNAIPGGLGTPIITVAATSPATGDLSWIPIAVSTTSVTVRLTYRNAAGAATSGLTIATIFVVTY